MIPQEILPLRELKKKYLSKIRFPKRTDSIGIDMKHRGKGDFGLKVKHPKDGWITQWFRTEVLRNEYEGNLNRHPEYRGCPTERVKK